MPRKSKWRDFENLEVAAVFDKYPPKVRATMMQLRELIFETAETTEGVGEVEEALRWGEPSYLTVRPKTGTTIRIDSKAPDHCALYVHCQTDLIARFRKLYPKEFRYEGTRSVVLDPSDGLPETALGRMIALALRYRLDKKTSSK